MRKFLLRSSFFLNFHGDDYKNGAIYLSAGDGKVAWVDVRDIAAVNAEVLLNPEKYRNQVLTVSDTKALSYTEAVAVLNNLFGTIRRRGYK
ncbi:hypothetical protein QUF90_11310 [Desulfococcaceae bacterium HSG9]|nr:hypothetical protein [Desulfococcaceae bacterium HSG9]